VALIPLALKASSTNQGSRHSAAQQSARLRRRRHHHPFFGIKAIDLLLVALHLA